MSNCECGFDFVQARLDGRDLESYAVVHDEDYQRLIDDELAIRREVDEERQLELISESSTRVGTLFVCPDCGGLLLFKPQRNSADVSVLLLRVASHQHDR